MVRTPTSVTVNIHDDIDRSIVVLCGSTEFMHEFEEANREQTALGRIVLSVGCNMKKPHPLWDTPRKAEEVKARLDALHRDKIKMAHWVLVVGTRVGDSTRAEIDYAISLGKIVAFYHPEVEAEFRNVLGLRRLAEALREDNF